MSSNDAKPIAFSTISLIAGVSKKQAKGTNLRVSAKNKEQGEGLRRAKETPAINPRHIG